MRFVDSEQMRALDKEAIEGLGIPALVLMENAGRAAAEEIMALCCRKAGRQEPMRPEPGPTRYKAIRHAAMHHVPMRQASMPLAPIDGTSSVCTGMDERAEEEYEGFGGYGSEAVYGEGRPAFAEREHWLIMVGKGNNGGDGLVCARHLLEAGVKVTLLYALPPEQLSGEARVQLEIAEKLHIPAKTYLPGEVQFAEYTGIVDSLLGTGSKGAPRGNFARLIEEANASGLPIVAMDIPSGIDANTGEIPGVAVNAALTVCLGFLKAGLTQYPAAAAAGQIAVRRIGIPEALAAQGAQAEGGGFVLTPASLHRELGVDVQAERRPDGHKGTYGHVLLAGGSLAMTGACLLAGRAALRAGCGLATWALPAGALPHVLGAVPELMLAPAGAAGESAWSAAAAADVLRLLDTRDVLAAGPGLGRFDGDAAWLRALWEGARTPLVLDADALNILAEADGLKVWPRRNGAATILTPHPGEMARLAGISTAEVQRDRLGLARRFAAEHGVTLVLKGARTVVAEPGGRVFVNATGNPGMATGGTGDVLTGIIAGLLAQGNAATPAACLGVYLHGAAGDKAAARRGSAASIIAGDLIEAL